MNLTKNALWTLVVSGLLLAAVGCNKPSGGDKTKPAAPEGAPANTTDSK